MLGGFRGSKCKTSCKLCVSRIKLLRNKREIQLTGQRREVAKLLSEGKNEYAWIRVEAIIRERNLLMAYEILELYLELIAVRTHLLEKHKTCPKDMIEAITTIMFAAPRVADLPELTDVRKWLTIKYGKELGTEGGKSYDGAEPPDWQVNLRLRQYLAVEAPEAEDKLSMVSAIAQEMNVDFDMESYAQSVMVQLDPIFQPPAHPQPPPPPPPPQQQQQPFPPQQRYPPMNVAAPMPLPPPQQAHASPFAPGNVPPSLVTPSSPETYEPREDAPVRPPAQPSFQVPHPGPSTGPYTDAQVKLTGTTYDVDDDGLSHEASNKPQMPMSKSDVMMPFTDDAPPKPNKECFHEVEETDDVLPDLPTAPPQEPDNGLPSAPGIQKNFSIDSDLTRRLDELRKR